MNDSDTKQKFTLDISGNTPKIHPRKDTEKPANKTVWFYLGTMGNFGVAIVVPLLIGLFGGIWFDTTYGTKPTGTLIGLLIGLVLSVATLIRTVQDVIKQTKN